MIVIEAQHRYLSYKGDTQAALSLVESLHNAYLDNGLDMPKMLNDFVFGIETALQDAGVLDEWFNETGLTT